MDIIILCDQKDCLHNVGNKVHHDHSNDRCLNIYPILPMFFGLGKRLCSSKKVSETRTGALFPSNPKVG